MLPFGSGAGNVDKSNFLERKPGVSMSSALPLPIKVPVGDHAP